MNAPISTVRAWRNNNPLNIRPLAHGQLWTGQVSVDSAGTGAGFAMFDSPASGWLAGYTLLRNYQLLHDLRTVAGVCNRWAPPADDNPTSAYIETVCTLTGFAPEQRLDLTDPAVLRKMGDAMSVMEGGHLDWAEADKDMAIAKLSPHQAGPAPDPVVTHPDPVPPVVLEPPVVEPADVSPQPDEVIYPDPGLIHDNSTVRTLSFAVSAGFFLLIIAVIGLALANRDLGNLATLIGALVGIVGGGFQQILNFHFGTSASSGRKSTAINAALTQAVKGKKVV